jgi:hypothetical protein
MESNKEHSKNSSKEEVFSEFEYEEVKHQEEKIKRKSKLNRLLKIFKKRKKI